MKKVLLLSFIISAHLFCADAKNRSEQKIRIAIQEDNSEELSFFLSNQLLKPNDQIDNDPLLINAIEALAPNCVETLLDANADPNSTFSSLDHEIKNSFPRELRGPFSALALAFYQQKLFGLRLCNQQGNDFDREDKDSDDECDNVTGDDITKLDNIVALLKKNNADGSHPSVKEAIQFRANIFIDDK